MDALLYIYAALCAAMLVQAGLMYLHAWEHSRFHASRLATSLKAGDTPRVTLFVPCKGVDLDIDANLSALFAQQYPAYEICFILEQEGDPPADIIATMQTRYPHVASRIVYAGHATDCGQKVHNLMVATRTVGPQTEVLAFVDSDARPHAEWLARLVDKIRGRSAVSTGYRWYAPVRATLPNLLLSAINNTVTGLMGPHGFNLVWGGAWAIRAEAFREIGLPEAWRGSLSDDLVVSRLVQKARLKVAYDPHCLVTSSADMTWRTLAEFLRRQYLVVRVYAPTFWWGALAAGGFALGFGTLSLVMTCIWAAQGGPWWLAVAGAVASYTLTAGRAAIRNATIRPFVMADSHIFQSVAKLDVLAWPLVSLVQWLGIAAAGLGRTIVWRGISYQLVSSNKTIIGRREPVCAVPAIPSSSQPKTQRAAA